MAVGALIKSYRIKQRLKLNFTEEDAHMFPITQEKIFNTGYQPKVGDLVTIPFELVLFGWNKEKDAIDLYKMFKCETSSKKKSIGTMVLVEERQAGTSNLHPMNNEFALMASNLVNASCRTKVTIWQIFDDSQKLVYNELNSLGYIRGFIALANTHLVWVSLSDLKILEYSNKHHFNRKIIQPT